MSNIVTIGVSSLDQVNDRIAAAFRGEPQGCHISFPSVGQKWRILNRKRWELLQAMTCAGPMSIREVARRAGRDVKAVHGDVTALIKAGVIDRDGRRVVFPYDGVHVDLVFGMAA